MMAVRGIRGATTADENNADKISAATKDLLREIVSLNNLSNEDIVSLIFSATDDLNAAYPAVAAREIGFDFSPLFCVQEMQVKGSLRMCLRVLVHVNTEKDQKDMVHVYQKGARVLRPDLSGT
jgi:chorismate mutase